MGGRPLGMESRIFVVCVRNDEWQEMLPYSADMLAAPDRHPCRLGFDKFADFVAQSRRLCRSISPILSGFWWPFFLSGVFSVV